LGLLRRLPEATRFKGVDPAEVAVDPVSETLPVPVTILVVDDAHDTREVLVRLLRREGYRAVCATNGWEAFQALEKFNPAAVVLDIGMPVMDGLSMLRAIRQDPSWRHLPVLLLTGNADERFAEEARYLGASEFLVKGSTPLPDVIRRVRHYAPPRPEPAPLGAK
jgi:CheY-like chemotaxis protein